MPTPALFLDRDGVIIENRMDYVKALGEMKFIPGALEALARVTRHGERIVIVTNQSAVGRGLLTHLTLEAIHRSLLEHITAAGGRIDSIYVCPHHPDDQCDCRKPAPGLLLRAARELGIDLSASVLIGDNLTDVLAARAVGVRPILVNTGLGATQPLSGVTASVLRCHDLAHAVETLLHSGWPTQTLPLT
jgi:D-glycero-D-manno-heptose 1,7-bisphosphate phosphatase